MNINRIHIKNLYKKFNVEYVKHVGALSFLIKIFSFRDKEQMHIKIANDLSFDLYAGKILGLIGKNGTGKSSLLRVIAGIYTKDSGIIETKGKVVYLSGIGHGLSMKLTMRENIILMGSILGLRTKEIAKKFNDIVEFSGLKDYLDLKLYQFSTGMISRLSFSVMIHCVDHHKPDILLVDEVLSAGGDFDFQNKATKKIEDMIKGGAAVILVSHDMEVLKKYCDEVIWLEDGIIKKKGDPVEVIDDYLKSFNV